MQSVKLSWASEDNIGTADPLIDVREIEIGLEEGVSPIVEVLLREVCLCSEKVIGLASEDEQLVAVHMRNYRRKFDNKFSDADYRNDGRVRNMLRILDFCYKVGFQFEAYFDDKFFWQRNSEELIGDFRNLVRLTLIGLAEEHNLIPYLKKAKIPLIKGGKEVITGAARDLADKITAHTLSSTVHLKAAMVLLLQIFQTDPV